MKASNKVNKPTKLIRKGRHSGSIVRKPLLKSVWNVGEADISRNILLI